QTLDDSQSAAGLFAAPTLRGPRPADRRGEIHFVAGQTTVRARRGPHSAARPETGQQSGRAGGGDGSDPDRIERSGVAHSRGVETRVRTGANRAEHLGSAGERGRSAAGNLLRSGG